MSDRFDLDTEPPLFVKLREKCHEWDFEWAFDERPIVTAHLAVCFPYEFLRERQDFKNHVLEWRRTGVFDDKLSAVGREFVTEFASSYPSWPARPYVLAQRESSDRFVHYLISMHERLTTPISLPLSWGLSDEWHVEMFKGWLKRNRPRDRKPRGRGAHPVWISRYSLRQLGHARLWRMITEETEKLSNPSRFNLYSDFLHEGPLKSYSSLHKLTEACGKVDKLIRNLLGTPSYLQPATNTL
jgi:hypothetical protein